MAKLYFRQLRNGREFAQSHPVASDMANFIYLIGDADAGECLVVDPAWDPEGLIRVAAEDGMKVVGAICTHYHGDHLGGSFYGMHVEGLKELLDLVNGKAYCHEVEKPWIVKSTKVDESKLILVEDQSEIRIGDLAIKVHFTPGHTAGGICLEFAGHLVTADTLFLNGCGRTDLPGGNAGALYDSLYGKLAKLSADLKVFCGHAYSGDSQSLEWILENNPIFRAPNRQSFIQMMGG